MQEVALQETMIYSAKTAIMGIFIVFTFLALLSLLMWLIKAFFNRFGSGVKTGGVSRKTGRKPRSTEGDGEKEKAGTTPESEAKKESAQAPDWLTAAVSVFLLMEADEAEISADAWRPSSLEKAQLWILSGVHER